MKLECGKIGKYAITDGMVGIECRNCGGVDLQEAPDPPRSQ